MRYTYICLLFLLTACEVLPVTLTVEVPPLPVQDAAQYFPPPITMDASTSMDASLIDSGVPDSGSMEQPLSDAALAWKAKRELLEGLPYMLEELVAEAVEVTNQELEDNQYPQRVQVVTVQQGTLEQLQTLSGETGVVCGWTPGRKVYILEGDDLCDYFLECPTKRIGWVLSHELLHTVGLHHTAETKVITDKLGQRWRMRCELDEDDGGV